MQAQSFREMKSNFMLAEYILIAAIFIVTCIMTVQLAHAALDNRHQTLEESGLF